MTIHLLLARGEEQSPVLPEGLSLASVLPEPQPKAGVGPKQLYDLNGDPNDLSTQRWALVVPQGRRGARLLQLVERLRHYRAEQQGLHPDQVLVFQVPPAMNARDTEEFRHKLLKMQPQDQPRYLLVLGDADEVSFEFQQYLALDRFVGRLTFDTDDDFEAYVGKILNAEQAAPHTAQGRALFFASHDGTRATEHGYKHLISRSLQSCKQACQRGTFPASEVLEVRPTTNFSAQGLIRTVSEPLPTTLLTLSHGNAGPTEGWRSAAEQRKHQGELVLGNGQILTTEDVGQRAFLHGGIWIYFACFSAGTPARSAYAPWLQRIQNAGEGNGDLESVLGLAPLDGRPFVAALPKAALANPQGPLAVIGHVDLAWSYSYHDVDGHNHSDRFTNVLRDLMKHRRAGVSFYSLISATASIDTRLTMLYHQDEAALYGGEEAPKELLDRAYLWMARHDLSAYVLLGDPAARLSLKPIQRKRALRPPTRRGAP